MKSLIASILLVGFVIAEADAQTTKGSFLVGGSGYLQRNKYHVASSTTIVASPTTTFSITPTVGYFPVNNFMIGLQGNYLHSWQSQNDVKGRSNSFTIGPVLRYYFPFAGRFAAFPEAAAQYNQLNTKANGVFPDGTVIDEKSKSVTAVYRAGAGVTWFVRPNIGIEMVLGYQQTNQKSRSDYTSILYSRLAVQFYLSGKN